MKVSGFFRCFLCCLLVCALLIPTFAAAEKVDLKSLSDADIVELLTRVNQEIADRGINKTAKLAKGAYVTGKDLPAGRYIFTVMAVGDDWGNVTVHNSAGKLVTWEVVSAPEKGQDPETIFITLSDGDKLESGVPFSLTIMSGAIFK